MSDHKTTDNIIVTCYNHAPITEALIDIQFKRPSVSLEELITLQEEEIASYPEKKNIFLASVKFGEMQPGQLVPGFSEQSSSQTGWEFVAANKPQIGQVRTGGFTFSAHC